MKVRVVYVNTFLITMITGLTLSFQACSPNQGMRFKQAGAGSSGWASANGGTTTDNPKPTTTIEIGQYHEEGGGGASIRLCVTEVRMESSTTDLRLNLSPKWITLQPTGTVIDDSLRIPFGNYRRIELRLSDSCGGLSASVTNSHGTFNLNDEMHVRFSGSVDVIGASSRLVLDMGGMINAIEKADDKGNIEDALTESEGGCGGG